MIVTNQNCIHKEINSRLNMEHFLPFSSELPCHLLPKDIKIFKTKSSVILYRCETWCHTLREECRLRVFENKVLMRIYGPTRDGGSSRRLENIIMNFTIHILHQILSG
jgi:hypothetical protein